MRKPIGYILGLSVLSLMVALAIPDKENPRHKPKVNHQTTVTDEPRPDSEPIQIPIPARTKTFGKEYIFPDRYKNK